VFLFVVISMLACDKAMKQKNGCVHTGFHEACVSDERSAFQRIYIVLPYETYIPNTPPVLCFPYKCYCYEGKNVSGESPYDIIPLDTFLYNSSNCFCNPISFAISNNTELRLLGCYAL
jgi:hypothetical protein